MEEGERRARLAYHIRMIALLGGFKAVESSGDQGMSFFKDGEKWVITPFGIERSVKINAILEVSRLSSELERTSAQLLYFKNRIKGMADSLMLSTKETNKIKLILDSNVSAEEKTKQINRYLDSLIKL
jgi:hypothetical protein